MKIIESESAQLTNYEVFVHLTDQKERYNKLGREKGRRPGNLETVVREVSPHLPLPLPLSITDQLLAA